LEGPSESGHGSGGFCWGIDQDGRHFAMRLSFAIRPQAGERLGALRRPIPIQRTLETMIKHLVAVLAALSLLAPILAHAADPALSPESNAAFLARNATKPGVIVRPSGLQYRILQNGSGKRPGATDHVTVYYTGMLINGRVFDGTEPGFPADLVTNAVIPGWSEALQLMREGDHWQLFIPSKLGYGARGAGDGAIPPNQTLLFDVQLVAVTGLTKQEQEEQELQAQKDQEAHPGPGAQ